MTVPTSHPTREVIISVLHTSDHLGSGGRRRMRALSGVTLDAIWPDGWPIYALTMALSIMVFFALRAQCLSTIVVIRKEIGFWRWLLLRAQPYT